MNPDSDRLLEYIARSQTEQTACLHDLAERLARIEERTHDLALLDGRVTSLEHHVTRARTALMLVYTGAGMVVSAVVWLFAAG